LPIIVLRASGEHYSSGGEIRGLIDASPEHVSRTRLEDIVEVDPCFREGALD
jgi:hypothetical protein